MLVDVTTFFFNDTPTTEIYTLSLHDALPISVSSWKALNLRKTLLMASSVRLKPLNCSRLPCVNNSRSEERFSRNAETDLVCRLLLEKKKKRGRHYIAGKSTDVGVMYGDVNLC